MRNIDLPLPNVYYVTVQTALNDDVHHIYVAADYNGDAIEKIKQLCQLRFGFTPFRSNSSVKMRRFRLQDYLDCPEGLGQAMVSASDLGDQAALTALQQRPAEVRNALLVNALAPRTSLQSIDTANVMAALNLALAEVA